MDLDDIFEMLDDGEGDESAEESLEPPDYRATIRGDKVTVIAWMPHLLGGGPTDDLIRARAGDGVTIADLWVTEDEPAELIATYLAVADRKRADRLLARWAEAVGYTRLWLPGRLVALDEGRPLGYAKVQCPTCGAAWRDSSPTFWEQVRSSGRFPSACPICNADLPQWDWRPGRRRRQKQTR